MAKADATKAKAPAKKAAAAAPKKRQQQQQSYDLNSLSGRDVVALTELVRAAPRETTLLVWCHATWCGHCVAMKPEWAKLKRRLPAGVAVAEVENAVHGHLGSAHADNEVARLLSGRVQGFPTVLRVRFGAAGKGPQVVAYEGARTADALAAFAAAR